MITHYFTLLALRTRFEAGLSGAVIRDAFTQVKNELVVTLETGGGVQSLMISLAPRKNVIYFREGESRARRNSVSLFPGIHGGMVGGFSLGELNRVISLRAGEKELRIHLFNSAASNVFLLDGGGVILDAFKKKKEYAGLPYEEFSGSPGPGSVIDFNGLDRVLRRDASSRTGVVLKKVFPHMGPLYLTELMFRAGLDPEIPVGEISSDDAQRVYQISQTFLEEAGSGSAWLYRAPGREDMLSAVALRHLHECAAVRCDDVNEAVRKLFIRRERTGSVETERKQLIVQLGREREKISRSLRETTAIAGDATLEDQYRKSGDLILMHLHELRKGQTVAELTDMSSGGMSVRIELDRSMTPAENAERYFARARNARRSKEEAVSRLAVLRSRLHDCEELLSRLEDCRDIRSLRGIKMKIRSDRSIHTGEKDEERLPFRVIPIGENFEAWVGKSSAGNDLLTKKYARPNDYWFHVRGASGSHVVLKRRGGNRDPFPKEALLAAARIAAYYSKMRKGGIVPVACCERKYVKKPKNAPAGTVTLQREEILFVEPSLP